MRRLKKILLRTFLALVVLLVLLGLFGPAVLAPIIRKKVVEALNENLNGTAEIADFSFGWGGSARLEGLAIRDPKGELVFSTREVAVDASVMSALGGTYVVDLRVSEPAVVVRRHADGTFNLETLLKPRPPPPPPTEEPTLPTLKVNVTLERGQLTLVREDGRRTEATLDARCAIDTLDRPITFEATVGGIGTIALKGEMTIAKGGKLDLDRLHGPVGLTVSDVRFARLEPLVSAFAPLSRFEGVLEGRAYYEFTSMTSVKGDALFEVRGLDVAGAALPQPVKLDLVRLTQKAEMDGQGTGTAGLRLDLGDFLAASVDARTVGVAARTGIAEATLTVDAKLKGLTDALGTLLGMKPDYKLDGSATLKASFRGSLGAEALGAAQLEVGAKIEGLSAKDGRGQLLPIDPSATLDLRASFEPGQPVPWAELAARPSGTARVETCELRAGTVAITARTVADLAKGSFGDSALQVDADLDDVAKKVAFMDLGFSFGGKVHLDSKLEGSGDVVKALSTVRVSALRLTGFRGKDLGPIDLTLDEAGTVDLRPGGRSTLESFRLVSGLVDAEAKAEALDATDAAKAKGTASFTVKAYPAAIQKKLGDFLAGYSLSGSDLVLSGQATFVGKEISLKGDLKTRELAVKGPTLGPSGATLRDVSLLCDLACDLKTLDCGIKDVTLGCGALDAALMDPDATARADQIVARLSGSKNGDRLALRVAASLREAVARSDALDLKGSKVSGIEISGDLRADLAASDFASDGFTLKVKSAEAGTSDASAALGEIVARLSGSKRGDDVVLSADLKVQGVHAKAPQLGPKGAVVEGISFACDATANLKTLEAEAREASFGIATIDAWRKDASKPASVRDLKVSCRGTRKGDLLDLLKLELRSSLAKGDGSLKITNLMKEGMAADGRFDFGGDVAPLVDLAKVFVPDMEKATSAGTWRLAATVATTGKRITVAPEFRVERVSLDGYKVGDNAVRIDKADLALVARAIVDTSAAGKATVESLSFTAPGATITATGTAGGFLSHSHKLEGALRLEAKVQPEELDRRLSALLLGYRLKGKDLEAVADVAIDGRAYGAKGSLSAEDLVLTMPPAPPKEPGQPKPQPTTVAQRDLLLEFDVQADLGKERVEIRKCVYESRSARGSIDGTVDGFGAGTAAKLTARADADLQLLREDLGTLLPKDYDLKGRGAMKFDVVGKGDLAIAGLVTVEGFSLTVPGEGSAEPTTVSDPRIAFECDAAVKRGQRTDIALKSAKVTSAFLNGSMSGSVLDATKEAEFKAMKGDFAYIPDKLGAVLKPWLFGGTLTGAEEQRVTFTLDGRARDFDPIRMLRSSDGQAKIGIGQFTMTGLAAKGNLDAKVRDEHATSESKLGVNGGGAELRMDIDLREPTETVQPVSTAGFTLKKVAANAQVSPLLQLVHPIFGSIEQVNGMIEGTIDANLDLSYKAPVTTELLKQYNKPEADGGGWKNLDKRPIEGKGRFAITGLKLTGAPFLSDLLSKLEINSAEGINLEPISFTIRDERVFYDNPVPMKFGGETTLWSGSIGLDQSLALEWSIPVSERLVQKYSFLKYWAGQNVVVKVGGTSSRPKLLWQDFIQDLTKQAARKAIEERAAEGLEGLLNKDEKRARNLLEDADRLYDQGKKADAAAIYKRIRTEYRKTKAYERNKARIDERESGQ